MPLFTSDTFTDSSSTLLENHTGGTGATWTKNAAFPAGSAAITAADRVRGAATNAVYYASGTPAAADYDVEADLYVASNVAGAGIAGRMSASAETYYLLDYEASGGQWRLYTIVNATTLNTTNFAQALTVGQTYHVRLCLRGSQITCYVNGVQIISITDANITAAGHAGLFFAAADTDSTGFHLDNFTAATPLTSTLADVNLYFSPYNWSGNGAGAMQSNNLPASSTSARSNTPGAYLKFNLTAAANGLATLLLDTTPLSGITAANCPTLAISIDGQAFTTPLLAYSASPVRLNLAANLSSGPHTLIVYFRSVTQNSSSAMGDRWNTPASCVAVTGLELDGKGSATSAPTLHSKRMLVYGDSITEGCDAVGSANGPADQDSTQTYAQLLAAALDAEVGIVGFAAQGWSVTGYGNVPRFYDTTTPTNSSFDKFFSGTSRLIAGALSPIPDYVLILHGTNDANFGAADSAVTASVSALLPALRAAVGSSCLIFLTIPFAGGKRTAITTAYSALSDPCTHLLDLGAAVQSTLASGGLYTNDALHPNTRGHPALASQLLSQIRPYISGAPSTFQASTGVFNGGATPLSAGAFTT